MGIHVLRIRMIIIILVIVVLIIVVLVVIVLVIIVLIIVVLVVILVIIVLIITLIISVRGCASSTIVSRIVILRRHIRINLFFLLRLALLFLNRFFRRLFRRLFFRLSSRKFCRVENICRFYRANHTLRKNLCLLQFFDQISFTQCGNPAESFFLRNLAKFF